MTSFMRCYRMRFDSSGWQILPHPLFAPRGQSYIDAMKQILLPASLVLALSSPLAAQEAAETDSGPSLMERGTELFLRGLQQEMAPALEDLQGLMQEIGPSLAEFLSEMGPALAGIAAEVEDWSVYEMPEILPNGDIIIRRKPSPEDTPEVTPDTGTQDGAGDGAIDI